MAEYKLNAGIGSPHPECHNHETFVGYTNQGGFGQIGWTTKRAGTRVFDDNGREVTEELAGDIFPVFAQETELVWHKR